MCSCVQVSLLFTLNVSYRVCVLVLLQTSGKKTKIKTHKTIIDRTRIYDVVENWLVQISNICTTNRLAAPYTRTTHTHTHGVWS